MDIIQKLIEELNTALGTLDFVKKSIINNLQPVLDELTKRINELESKNKELEERVKELENK